MKSIRNVLTVFFIVVGIALHERLSVAFSAILILFLHPQNPLFFFADNTNQHKCICINTP